ncbi:MAG: hypothetical protein KGJ14_09145 [Nitrospirota bacterium]|nr:hypothetical protein [Nitrospirota bacterium]
MPYSSPVLGTMDSPDHIQPIEIAVTYRFAQQHGWVVTAITGFLSAYFMEDARFRYCRQIHDLESGAHLWLCEVGVAMPVPRLVKRLQADLPPSQMRLRPAAEGVPARYLLDLPEVSAAQSEAG